MKAIQPYLLLGLLLLFFRLSAADILQSPQNVTVEAGGTGVLTCTFTVSAIGCFWTKNTSPVEIINDQGRYHYVNDNQLENGDCSIEIVNADLIHDDGWWQCGMPVTSEYDPIVSDRAKFTVLQKPQDPELYVNDNLIIEKGHLPVPSGQNPLNIMCQSVDGNPATKLTLKLGSTVLNSNFSITNGSSSKLWTSKISTTLPGNDTSLQMENQVLYCVAEHPSYNSTNYQKQVYVYFGKIQPPTNMKVEVVGYASSNNVQVPDGTEITILCNADYSTELEFQWLNRNSDQDAWKVFKSGNNITFPAYTVQLTCQAWYKIDDASNKTTATSEIISINTPSSSSKAQTGTIVAIVVVVIVLVILMVAGVFGLYKKKLLCFKDELASNPNLRDYTPASVTQSSLKDDDSQQAKEQTVQLLDENKDRTDEEKAIIYTEVQTSEPKNTTPPARTPTVYSSVQRPYGIQ